MPTSHCTICMSPVTIPEGKSISNYKTTLAFTAEPVTQDNTDPVTTKCDHVFHTSCLQEWIQSFKDKTSSASCPICRVELMKPAVIPSSTSHVVDSTITQNIPFSAHSSLILEVVQFLQRSQDQRNEEIRTAFQQTINSGLQHINLSEQQIAACFAFDERSLFIREDP